MCRGSRPTRSHTAGRRGLLRLDFNEHTIGPSPRVLAALAALTGEDLALYPDEGRARAAIARHLSLGGRSDFVLTSGADEAIRLVCDGYVSAGERVLILEPGYAMYRFYATLAGAEIDAVTVEPDLGLPGRRPANGLARAAAPARHPRRSPQPDGHGRAGGPHRRDRRGPPRHARAGRRGVRRLRRPHVAAPAVVACPTCSWRGPSRRRTAWPGCASACWPAIATRSRGWRGCDRPTPSTPWRSSAVEAAVEDPAWAVVVRGGGP